MKKNLTLFIVGILVTTALLAGIAYVATKPFDTLAPTNTLDESGLGTTTPNYTVEIQPEVSIRDIMPSLDRGIVFDTSIPLEVQTLLKNKFNVTVLALNKNPEGADDWFELGIIYHSANDYEGARLVWEFLGKIITPPGNAVAYENLGKLYKFSLKDFSQSELYLKKAITANSKSISPYFELHELYRYLYKTNTTLAVDILNEASAKFPQNVDPLVLIGQYYREKGEITKARTAFMKALDLARSLNDVKQISSIGDELANLPK